MKRFSLLLTALTTLSHGDTSSADTGNNKLFMRSKKEIGGRVRTVPAVSGNALRHNLIREPLSSHLLGALGYGMSEAGKGKLPQGVVTLLYSGGAMDSASPSDALDLTDKIRRLYPMLDLIGGAVDGFILGRSRLRLAAWIVAKENNRETAPYGITSEVSLFDLLGDEGRTTFRAGSSAALSNLIDAGKVREEKRAMPYGYETLAAGSRILVELTLDPWTPPLTESALAVALEQFDGFVCGQGRQGHGRVSSEWLGDKPDPLAYQTYVDGHGDALRAGLEDGSLGTPKIVVR